MKKELAASSLKMFEFICNNSDVTGRLWYSKLPMTSTFHNDCRILISLGLIEVKSAQTHPTYIRLTNKGSDLSKGLNV
ncbi:hypothetical protein R5R51_06205 [Oenococcus oeni]